MGNPIMTRRLFVAGTAAAAFAQQKLPPEEFQPKSMLRVKETKLSGRAFPVIDFHAHPSWAARSEKGVALTGERKFIAPPKELLPVMER
jgi:hypothetical protein